MNLVESAVKSVNALNTQYLLFGFTTGVLFLYSFNQTQEMKEIFMFCLGGLFAYINNEKQ